MSPVAACRAVLVGTAGLLLTLGGARAAIGARQGDLASTPLRALDARSAALLVSGQQGGTLDLRLYALGEAGAPGGVELVLDVAAAGLAPAEEQAHVPLAVYVYALDAGGRVAGMLKEGIRLDSVALTGPWRAGVKFVARIALEPGEYRLRALAVRADNREFGLVLGEASVPAPGVPVPALVALEPAARWLMVRPAGGPALTGLLARPDDGLAPAAEPLLSRGAGAKLELRLRDADPATGWRVQLAGAGPDRELEPVPAGDRWELRFPDDLLSPGVHRLSLVGPGAAAALAGPPWVAGEIRDVPADLGRHWTDLGATAAAARVLPPAPLLQEDARAGDELERLYLEAIGQLAGGEEWRALETLLGAEPAALQGDSGDRFSRLHDVELRVAADLAAIDAESLLPLVRLHELAYEAYLDAGLPALATRARLLTVRLALGYSQRSEHPEARSLAARALESLAARVLVGGGRLETARLLADAIELDARAEASLRGLALLLEFGGQYAEALAYLERAVELAPADRELRLRLAVQRARLGDGGRAESGLRDARENGPDWVRVVAAQELARLLAARGAREEAVALLRAELELRPDAGTRLQLANVLDALDRRREATELLLALEAAETGDVASPRRRYDRLREFHELATSAAQWAAEAGARVPALAASYAELRRRLRRR